MRFYDKALVELRMESTQVRPMDKSSEPSDSARSRSKKHGRDMKKLTRPGEVRDLPSNPTPETVHLY